MTRAFTLIEMLVSLAIFTVIMAVVLFNNTDFNSSVFLSNAAFDVALNVREMQQYGVASRGQLGDFKVGYGVFFFGATPSLGATSYKTFSDINANKRYDSTSDTDLSLAKLPSQYTVRKYCAIRTDNTTACSDSGSPIAGLAVTFLRPETDASISTYATDVSGNYTFLESNFAAAEITLQSKSGAVRSVYIQTTGQISVKR